MEKNEHEHKYVIVDIYQLVEHAYVVCRLVCECYDERWDVGTPCD